MFEDLTAAHTVAYRHSVGARRHTEALQPLDNSSSSSSSENEDEANLAPCQH